MKNDKKQTEDLGSVVGIIIVIILLLIGAFYLVGQRIEKSKQFQASLEQATATAAAPFASSSDQIPSL